MTRVENKRWKLGSNPNHCETCADYANQEKPSDEWDTIATPPLHDGCHCSLVRTNDEDIEDIEADPDGPPGDTADPSTPSGTNNENPPAAPAPADHLPWNPPGTPATVTIRRRRPRTRR